MSRMIAALMRHGDYRQLPDSPSAYQPFPLTEKGVQQAQSSVALLRQHSRQLECPLNPVIASSTLLRAWQTASVIAENMDELQASVMQHEDLAERCVGSVANLSTQQIAEILHQDPRYPDVPDNWKSDSHYCLPFPGAESLMQAGQRVASVLKHEMEKLRQRQQGPQIKLFVGHGAAFRHAAYHLGVIPFEQIAKISMYHCQPVFLELHHNGTWSHVSGEWKFRQQQDDYTD